MNPELQALARMIAQLRASGAPGINVLGAVYSLEELEARYAQLLAQEQGYHEQEEGSRIARPNQVPHAEGYINPQVFTQDVINPEEMWGFRPVGDRTKLPGDEYAREQQALREQSELFPELGGWQGFQAAYQDMFGADYYAKFGTPEDNAWQAYRSLQFGNEYRGYSYEGAVELPTGFSAFTRAGRAGAGRQLRNPKGQFARLLGAVFREEFGVKLKEALLANFDTKIVSHSGRLREAVEQGALIIEPESEGVKVYWFLADLQRPGRGGNDPAKSTRDYGPIVFKGRAAITSVGMSPMRFKVNDYGSEGAWRTRYIVREAEPRDIFDFSDTQLQSLTNVMLKRIDPLAGIAEGESSESEVSDYS